MLIKFIFLGCLLLTSYGLVKGARPLSIFMARDEVIPEARSGRSLLFPFNGHHPGASHGHQGHHGHETDHAHSLHTSDAHENRLSRQNDEGGENDVDIGAVAAAGERCVEKVMMVEETEYDEEIECHHSYDERCHTTYSTDYEAQQEEQCDENFIKNCYIEYKTNAFDVPVEICNENLVRNCDKEGPEVCETVYETECETTYHKHEVEEDVPECRIMQVEKCKDVVQGYSTTQKCDKWPKQVCSLQKKPRVRYTPQTQCEKKPREVCGPGPCPIEQGPEECRQETKTIVQEIPEETCNLSPRKVCKFITKLVPKLIPKENCVDVPKEVCSRSKRNPRTVKRPVIKKWCYTPTPETGSEETTETPVDMETTTLPDTTTTDDKNGDERIRRS